MGVRARQLVLTEYAIRAPTGTASIDGSAKALSVLSERVGREPN